MGDVVGDEGEGCEVRGELIKKGGWWVMVEGMLLCEVIGEGGDGGKDGVGDLGVGDVGEGGGYCWGRKGRGVFGE